MFFFHNRIYISTKSECLKISVHSFSYCTPQLHENKAVLLRVNILNPHYERNRLFTAALGVFLLIVMTHLTFIYTYIVQMFSEINLFKFLF